MFGVTIAAVNELAEGHQLTHAHKPVMKKETFRVFLSDDINRICL
jgi:hypothetical protein